MREGRKKQFRSNTVEARTPYDFLPRCEMAEAALRLFILPTAGLVNDVTSLRTSPPIAERRSSTWPQLWDKGWLCMFFFSLLTWNQTVTYNDAALLLVQEPINFLKRFKCVIYVCVKGCAVVIFPVLYIGLHKQHKNKNWFLKKDKLCILLHIS